MGGLLGLSLLLLWVGNNPELVGGILYWVRGKPDSVSGQQWGWAYVTLWWSQLFDFSGVYSRDPWFLQGADLSSKRVVFNWMTKPGMKYLVVGAGAGLIMVWGMVMALEKSWGLARRVVGGIAQLRQMNPEVSARVIVEIAGTVRVQAGSGEIYVSGVESGDSFGLGNEVFATHFGLVSVRVVRGS